MNVALKNSSKPTRIVAVALVVINCAYLFIDPWPQSLPVDLVIEKAGEITTAIFS